MTAERSSGTRDRILVLLRRHGRLSAPRLAELLQLSSVGVRRHLTLLERDGLVGSTVESSGRGRPAAVYRLTDAGLETFPRHYDEVAREALTFLKGRDAATLSAFLAWRNERLAASYAGRVEGATLAERTDATGQRTMEEKLQPHAHVGIRRQHRAHAATDRNWPVLDGAFSATVFTRIRISGG